MINKKTKIVISGEGGQGIQTIAKVLTLALKDAGNFVSYIPQFGPEQRGAPSVSFVQFANEEINYPRFDKADYLIVLRERALPTINTYINSKTIVIFDSSTIREKLIKQSDNKKLAIPATKISSEKFNRKNINIIIIGYLSALFSLDEKEVWKLISKQLSKKFSGNAKLEISAKEALLLGYSFQAEKKNFSQAAFKTNEKISIHKNDNRKAIISPVLCKGCGICIEKCPVGALKFGPSIGVYGNAVPEIDLEKCIACGNCFRFCPDCAIKVENISKS